MPREDFPKSKQPLDPTGDAAGFFNGLDAGNLNENFNAGNFDAAGEKNKRFDCSGESIEAAREFSFAGRVTGSLVQSYLICPRQAWLMSRHIIPDQEHEYLAIGRLVQAQAYARQKKEIFFGHLKIDVLMRGKKNLVIGEVKKTSRARAVARMQLAFYLFELKEMGIEAEGELLFPEEREKETVILDSALAAEVARVKREVEQLLAQFQPPVPKRIPRCKHCAYAEFCWS